VSNLTAHDSSPRTVPRADGSCGFRLARNSRGCCARSGRPHFGDPNAVTADAGKVSAYFNADSGGSAIRGLFIQSNDSCAPILRTWMAPLRELGVTVNRNP
jgi:hypothetical protein